MRFKLFVALISVLVGVSVSSEAQDVGIRDTVSMVLTVDTANLEAVAEVWVFSDADLKGATAGFGWDNPNLQMDSAVVDSLVINGFDIGPFVYRDEDIDVTNTWKNFITGGASLMAAGIPGESTGRRLWATYYFKLSSWGGCDQDGITIDTLWFSAGSQLLFSPINGSPYQPDWEGKVVYCNPPLYLDPDPDIADTVALLLVVDTGSMKATVELYVYNDEPLSRVASGFTWNNANFQLTSVSFAPAVDSIDDTCRYVYRDDDINTTNDSMQFLFAGIAFRPRDDDIPAEPSGRRKWVTYNFTISSWGGIDSDGVTFDTLTFDSLSVYRFHARGNLIGFQPVWTGAVTFGNPDDVTPISAPNLPQTYTLSQNYPNPFNPSTEINFDVPVRSHVTLKVYNVLGQKVKTLVDEELAPKRYIADWDGTTDNGTKVASGIYFYKLEAGDFTETKKMLLLK